MKRLSGDQRTRLNDALRHAFPRDELGMLLRNRLTVDLDDIARPGDYQSVVFDVVRWAEQHGRLGELLRAVAAERPKREDLQAMVAEIIDGRKEGPPPPPSEQEAAPAASTTLFRGLTVCIVAGLAFLLVTGIQGPVGGELATVGFPEIPWLHFKTAAGRPALIRAAFGVVVGALLWKSTDRLVRDSEVRPVAVSWVVGVVIGWAIYAFLRSGTPNDYHTPLLVGSLVATGFGFVVTLWHLAVASTRSSL